MAKVRNLYNQLPNLTQDSTRESDKNKIKHNKREQRGQPFPAGDNKAAMNRHESITNTRHTYITQMIHKIAPALNIQ